MPFPKNHEYRWKADGEQSLDSKPICFKAKQGVRDKLKTIPNWQEQFRKFAEQLIASAENFDK